MLHFIIKKKKLTVHGLALSVRACIRNTLVFKVRVGCVKLLPVNVQNSKWINKGEIGSYGIKLFYWYWTIFVCVINFEDSL